MNVATALCPDCRGTGSVAGQPLHDHAASEVRSWCRTCYGWGLVRLPEDDDEQDLPELLWPESIRWRESA